MIVMYNMKSITNNTIPPNDIPNAVMKLNKYHHNGNKRNAAKLIVSEVSIIYADIIIRKVIIIFFIYLTLLIFSFLFLLLGLLL